MWIWVWIIGFLALLVLAADMLDRHRGSTGDYKADDLPGKKGGPRDHPDIDTSWG